MADKLQAARQLTDQALKAAEAAERVAQSAWATYAAALDAESDAVLQAVVRDDTRAQQ